MSPHPKTNLLFLGIDPGKAGWMVVVDSQRKLRAARKIPVVEVVKWRGKKKTVYDIDAMGDIFEHIREQGEQFALAALERAHPRPAIGAECPACKRRTGGEGTVSSFSSGEGYGLLRMGLRMARLQFVEVAPSAWKKFMLSNAIGEGKAQSVREACRIFPDEQFTGPRGGLWADKAEAALLADYARRTWTPAALRAKADP